MKIVHESPNSWQDLELIVAKILKECGFDAERGKQIATVRGTVDIDVFAKDSNSTPSSEYLIECKYWNTDIPQTVIHSFRTVVSDYGSQYGLIIAKKGFQSGAYEATKNTNIHLLSWDEFLSLFEKRWLQNRIRSIHYTAKPLHIYTDPLDVSDYLDHLSKNEISQYKKLCEKYVRYYIYSHESTFEEIASMSLSHKEQIDSIIKTAQKHFDDYSFNSYTDFFEHIEQKCVEGIQQFEELFKNTDVKLHVEKYC
ncbi:restriction endonuclease [Bacillus sp. DNRA2]|uniref:restriction endonuclease n=1 Tax=Bacillus sp. DNRA2 TaxID=2723053 RepID=UPI00145D31F4|nr:restriction endonuclease [Bacillus sp. DNRA2]NMD71527.1 restriction endonuclease [Bacillus sp. DNRA2]